jgi:hypothetical protein
MSQSGREHGMSDTTTYQTWAGMWQRCINPKNGNFKWYGARGISVCPEWRNFSVFFKDMGEQPSNRTLDREDNNGNYGPENCRWATKKVQNQNTRRATFVTVHGQRLCTTDAAKALNVDPSGVWAYVRRHGGTLQQAIDYYAAKSSFFQLPKEPTP